MPSIEPLPEATLAPFMTARDAPRVAFSELIERGMISPGTKLVDAKKRHGALVRADGAIMLGDKVGSIHRIGAVAQGSEACNGWTFWHIETKKGLRLIDELRAEIRSRDGGGLDPPRPLSKPAPRQNPATTPTRARSQACFRPPRDDRKCQQLTSPGLAGWFADSDPAKCQPAAA